MNVWFPIGHFLFASSDLVIVVFALVGSPHLARITLPQSQSPPFSLAPSQPSVTESLPRPHSRLKTHLFHKFVPFLYSLSGSLRFGLSSHVGLLWALALVLFSSLCIFVTPYTCARLGWPYSAFVISFRERFTAFKITLTAGSQTDWHR